MRHVRISRLLPALFVLVAVPAGLQGLFGGAAFPAGWALPATAAGLALAAAILAGRRVATPLDELAVAVRRLAAGDTAADIPHADRGDEIGALALAVAALRDDAAERQNRDRRNEPGEFRCWRRCAAMVVR